MDPGERRVGTAEVEDGLEGVVVEVEASKNGKAEGGRAIAE